MDKVKLGARTYLNPMPVVLVGAEVKGKPNYMTAGFVAVLNYQPVVMAIGLSAKHHTTLGIKKNRTFSVNIPSAKLIKEVDYCGLVSGRNVDKSKVFSTFYGKLKTAPMIEECEVSYECKLVKSIEMRDIIFLGQVVEAYASPRCLKGGAPDLAKINPLLLSVPDSFYWKVGKRAGKAWEIGKSYQPKK